MNSLSYKVPTDEAVMVMSKLTMIVNNGKFISCFTVPLLASCSAHDHFRQNTTLVGIFLVTFYFLKLYDLSFSSATEVDESEPSDKTCCD